MNLKEPGTAHDPLGDPLKALLHIAGNGAFDIIIRDLLLFNEDGGLGEIDGRQHESHHHRSKKNEKKSKQKAFFSSSYDAFDVLDIDAFRHKILLVTDLFCSLKPETWSSGPGQGLLNPKHEI